MFELFFLVASQKKRSLTKVTSPPRDVLPWANESLSNVVVLKRLVKLADSRRMAVGADRVGGERLATPGEWC